MISPLSAIKLRKIESAVLKRNLKRDYQDSPIFADVSDNQKEASKLSMDSLEDHAVESTSEPKYLREAKQYEMKRMIEEKKTEVTLKKGLLGSKLLEKRNSKGFAAKSKTEHIDLGKFKFLNS